MEKVTYLQGHRSLFINLVARNASLVIRIYLFFIAGIILFASWGANANEGASVASAGYHVKVLSMGIPEPSLQWGRNRYPVSVEIANEASSEIEFFAILSIDGIPQAPFSINVSGGPAVIRDTFVWIFDLNRPVASIRFRIVGFLSGSSSAENIVDITKVYKVEEPLPLENIHITAKGDNLSKISIMYYGTSEKWSAIYKKNRAVIGENPNLVLPGARLIIPEIAIK